MRAGIVGGGFMAGVHSAAIRVARACVEAVASSSAERSVLAAEKLGAARAEASADALLAGGNLDVLHVCTPNATHASIAESAIAAGLPVICEKPLATTADEARRLTGLLDTSGLVGTVPFVYRYHPMAREARARIAAGDGVVLSVDAAYLQDWLLDPGDTNWRATSGAGGASRAFADIGSHLFDLIEFVTGQRVTRLVATTRTVYPERGGVPVDNEDTASVLFELTGGGTGTAVISQLAAGRKNGLTLEVHGTSQAWRFEQEQPETLWIGGRAGSTVLPRDAGLLHPDAARLSLVPSGHPMGYQDAFNAFVADSYAAIAGTACEGLPTFHDGLRAAVLTEAVLTSAATGTWVATPPEDATIETKRSGR